MDETLTEYVQRMHRIHYGRRCGAESQAEADFHWGVMDGLSLVAQRIGIDLDPLPDPPRVDDKARGA